MEKQNGFEVLKLRNTQDCGSVSVAKMRKAKKVKLNKKQSVSKALKMQLLKNYGFKIEEN